MMGRRVRIGALAYALACTAALCADGRADLVAAEDPEPARAIAASLFCYVLPDEDVHLQPTVALDLRRLHLEARYNYEGLETGSAWVGYNIGVGEEVFFELTPMLGSVFGDLTGIAPGYRGSLRWRSLALYSEGEYVFDTDDHAESFFYSWSELTVAPVEGLRAGLVGQRTRVHEDARDIEMGFLIGLELERLGLTAHVFHPDESQPTYVFALEAEF